jgi:hypothetical protein
MRSVRALALLALVVGLAPAALAETHVNVSIGIGNAPPPPVVVVREQPHVVLVPGNAVYVVHDDRWDYDCFRYGVYWYAYRGGFWYRARGWRGPYVAVVASRVPRAIMTVPVRHWRHHPHGMPPGQARKVAVERRPVRAPARAPERGRVAVRDDDRNERGHDRGHKK